MTEAKAKPKASAYADMATAPQDGTHVMLTLDGEQETRALWQRTRRYDHGKWVPSGKWVYAWTRATISFEPLGWRAAPDEEAQFHADVAKAVKEDQARHA